MTLDDFLDHFAVVAKKVPWTIRNGGLRCQAEDGFFLCPLQYYLGEQNWPASVTSCGRLDLDAFDVAKVIAAADGNTASTHFSQEIRTRLLAATGIAL